MTGPNDDDCLAEMMAAGEGISRDEAEKILADLEGAARERSRMGDDPSEAYAKARDRKIDEEALRAAIARRNLRLDAAAASNVGSFWRAVVARKDLGVSRARLAAEALLVGINTPLFDAASAFGNQLSAAARGLGKKREWIGGAVNDMRRAGLWDVFRSRHIEDDIFKEHFELGQKAAGNAHAAGRTKNAQAMAIAEILQKWDKVRTTELNSVGGWIEHYAGRMFRTTWDPNRIRRASRPYDRRAPTTWLYKGFAETDRAQWAGDMAGWLDLPRTFGTSEEAENKLAQMFGGFVDGSFLQDVGEPDTNAHPNVASQVSHARELHFKSADAALAANKKYGLYSATDTFLHDMMQDADRWGLMKTFGTRPRDGFLAMLNSMRNDLKGTAEREDLNKWAKDDPHNPYEGPLWNRFAWVSGEAKRPIISNWSSIVNDWMSIQRVAKLGLTPFAMLADNTSISRELARQGLNLYERNASAVGDYFQGGAGTEKQHVAELLLTGITERLGGATSRFDIADARAGSLAWMENTFFEWTGITPMTANKRAGAERMMARHFGMLKGTEFAALPDAERRTMQAFGIGAKEWELLHKADWNTIDGNTYLTPDIAKKLSDDAVREYLGGRKGGATSQLAMEAGATMPINLVGNTRDDIANKLWAYFAERGQHAVLEVGPREKAMMYGNPQKNAYPLAMRLLLQFKQFPVATISRGWGADLYGNGKGLGRVAGVAELVIGSTIMGMAANYLNSVIKGQDPNASWRNNAANAVMAGFTRGGAGSIYGDFLTGEFSRFGTSLLDSLAGPTFGQTNKIAELYSDLTKPVHLREFKGPQTASLALKMARENAPFLNTIATKWAFDYLIYWRMMEHLSPGWAERYERTMKQNAGIEFLPGAGPVGANR